MTNPAPAPVPVVHAPHRPLTDYYETEQDRRAYLRKIFDDTAPDYDRIESMLAWGTGSKYRHDALVRSNFERFFTPAMAALILKPHEEGQKPRGWRRPPPRKAPRRRGGGPAT